MIGKQPWKVIICAKEMDQQRGLGHCLVCKKYSCTEIQETWKSCSVYLGKNKRKDKQK